MLLKFFIDYPYVVYSILGWAYIFIFIRGGLKRLWPMAILGGLILFGVTYWLVSAGLYRFNTYFLPILGISSFYIVWGAASGVIFGYYFGEKTIQRFSAILGFAGLVLLMESLVESVNRVEHLVKFNNFHEYAFDVMALSFLALIMIHFFESRLTVNKYKSKRKV